MSGRDDRAATGADRTAPAADRAAPAAERAAPAAERARAGGPDAAARAEGVTRHGPALLAAVHAAATYLQRPGYTVREALDAAARGIASLPLRGGVWLFDEARRELVLEVVADPGGYIAEVERLTGLSAKGYRLPVDRVPEYRQVVATRAPVFVPSTHRTVGALLPAAIAGMASRLLALLPDVPGIFVPVVDEGRVAGVLNFIGAGIEPADITVLQVLAHHIGLALGNARLVAALRDANARLAADIVERRRAEEALAHAENWARTLLDGMREYVILVEPDGRILLANQAAAQRLGCGPSALVGQNALALVPPEVAALRRQRAAGVVATGEPDQYRDEHSGRVFQHRVFPVFDAEGKVAQLAAFSTDVTEAARAEAAQDRLEQRVREAQKLESLALLAGGVAHDFNNILCGVLGNAELARRELPADGLGAELLGQVVEAAGHAAELCRQMLAYTGKGRLVVADVDLSAVVRDLGHLLATSCGGRGALELALASELPAVSVDRVQLHQVLLNLVTNGAEALYESGGTVRVTTGVRDCDEAFLHTVQPQGNHPPGRYAFVAVADDGIGMKPETAARMFDPFFTTKLTGRGLGLAASLGIVRGHGGAVHVATAPRHGTVVTVLLPTVPELPSPPPEPAQPAGAWQGRGTVLAVDDVAAVRTMARAMLEVCGFDVLVAADGESALTVCRAHRGSIRCVLLDVTMPGMGGARALDALRELDAALPVVLTSGYGADVLRDRLDPAERVWFIAKPYDLDTLRATMRAALGE